MLSKLKGFRTFIVVALGFSPHIIDALNLIDFDSGMLALFTSVALAIVCVLRVFTTTAPLKGE